MITSLSDQSLEILYAIADELDLPAKIHLSSTCTLFRGLLAPSIFKVLSFSNDARRAESAALAVQKYGALVKEIVFTGTAGPEDEDEHSPTDEALQEGFYADDASETSDLAETKWADRPCMPREAQELLEGSLTPNLHAARIKFFFDFEDKYDADWGGDGTGIGATTVFFEPEEFEAACREESIYKWRALMNAAWKALSHNKHVKKLVVDGFIPKPVTTFHDEAFISFLAQLEDFELSLYEWPNTDYHASCCYGYLAHASELDDFMFKHLKNVRSFKLAASGDAYLGCTGLCLTRLPLTGPMMPLARHVELTRIFIGAELLAFIREHKRSLKELHLHDCLSLGPPEIGNSEDGIAWSEFFEEILRTRPAIEVFSLSPQRWRITKHYIYGVSAPLDEQEKLDIEAAQHSLDKNPDHLVFGYGYVDDKYAFTQTIAQENRIAYRRGDDQRAYDAFMDFVKRNNEATSKLETSGQ